MDLKKRIADIAYKNNLSHLGSYYSSLGIIEEIYKKKSKDDIFILSSGHAALALYVVMEKYEGMDAEKLFETYGGHPHRNEKDRIYCSTGSLGLGLLVAIGRAMANRERNVSCLISDGECAEGSIWEGLRFIKESKIENLEVYVNVNGYAAYDTVDTKYLEERLVAFLPNINIRRTKVSHYSFLRGLNAHYHVMKEDDYKETMET